MTVPLVAVVVVTEGDAGRVVWLDEHPAIRTIRAMAAIRWRRRDLTALSRKQSRFGSHALCIRPGLRISLNCEQDVGSGVEEAGFTTQ